MSTLTVFVVCSVVAFWVILALTDALLRALKGRL